MFRIHAAFPRILHKVPELASRRERDKERSFAFVDESMLPGLLEAVQMLRLQRLYSREIAESRSKPKACEWQCRMLRADSENRSLDAVPVAVMCDYLFEASKETIRAQQPLNLGLSTCAAFAAARESQD